MNSAKKLTCLFLLAALLASCSGPPPSPQGLRVLAVETFLADITQNVAGDRIAVQSLIPNGVDPHAFEITPRDAARIAESQALILNGAGFEEWLDEVLQNAGGKRLVIEASAGLQSRTLPLGEHPAQAEPQGEAAHAHEGDPHFWLDPTRVIHYVENIRLGLVQLDPQGQDVYDDNARDYTARLQELDAWIAAQVQAIPPERRLLVTNHESLGYFADRYGFRIVGAIVPSFSSGASPSAQQLADLVDLVRSSGAPAIFLETGANPQLARQVAAETGASVVLDLYTHSLSPSDGPAPTYLDMMRYNTNQIVEALK